MVYEFLFRHHLIQTLRRKIKNHENYLKLIQNQMTKLQKKKSLLRAKLQEEWGAICKKVEDLRERGFFKNVLEVFRS